MAARLPVSGWVRNLPDGTVEMVVEGEPPALDELLAGIAGELGRFIEHCDVTVRPASGEFSSFEIAF
jgi:acylphosphatase